MAELKLINMLAAYTLHKPHVKRAKEFIRIIMDRNDIFSLQTLASTTFAKPSASNMKDLIERLIERADDSLLNHLIRQTFPEPHTEDMEDLIIKVILKSKSQINLKDLAVYVFAKKHTHKMFNALRLLIEKGDHETREWLKKLPFLGDFPSGVAGYSHLDELLLRAYKVLSSSLSISDSEVRKNYIEFELRKINYPPKTNQCARAFH